MATIEDIAKTLRTMTPERFREFLDDYHGEWPVDEGLTPEEQREQVIDSIVLGARHDQRLQRVLEHKLGLLSNEERSLRAAETSARAAEDSARQARWAKWAAWTATAIALAALLLSFWGVRRPERPMGAPTSQHVQEGAYRSP